MKMSVSSFIVCKTHYNRNRLLNPIMDLKRIALHVCAFLTTMTILWWIMRHAARSDAPKSGPFRYSWPAKLFVCFVVILLPLLILDLEMEESLRLGLIALEIVCLAVGLDVFTTRVTVAETHIEKSSVYGNRRISFSEISGIKRQDASQSYIIRAARNTTLKLSIYIDGIENLIQIVRERSGSQTHAYERLQSS